MGTLEPATWSARSSYLPGSGLRAALVSALAGHRAAAVDPDQVSRIPAAGVIGFRTTLQASEGVICQDSAQVDTGTPAAVPIGENYKGCFPAVPLEGFGALHRDPEVTDNDGLTGEDITTATLRDAQDPVPDVKANGSDTSLLVGPGEPVDVTIALDPGDKTGVVDWWVGSVTPTGAFWFTPSGWVRSATPVRFGALPLVDLAPLSILDIPFSEGVWTLFFILDDNPDGVFDVTWFDLVSVISRATPSDAPSPDASELEAEFLRKLRKWRGR